MQIKLRERNPIQPLQRLNLNEAQWQWRPMSSHATPSTQSPELVIDPSCAHRQRIAFQSWVRDPTHRLQALQVLIKRSPVGHHCAQLRCSFDGTSKLFDYAL
jgi:hypothetical protein